MKSIHGLLRAALLAILGVAGIHAQGAPAPAASSAHQAALRQYRENRTQGLLTGNPGPLAAGFSENIRLMPELHPTVFGAAGARAYYGAFLARFAVREHTQQDFQTFDLGLRVVEIGRFRQKLALKAAGRPFDLIGKYLDVWEKLPDGRLALVTAAWNYDAHLESDDLMRFPEIPSVRTAFQGRAPVNSNVSLELSALCRLLEVAVTQHDAGLWSRFHADDTILLANYSPLQSGRKAVDEYIAKHSRQLPVFEKLDIRNDRIEELDGYVLEYASHVANWRNGDSSGVNTGKNLRIWRREPDHALKIVLQIGSYD